MDEFELDAFGSAANFKLLRTVSCALAEVTGSPQLSPPSASPRARSKTSLPLSTSPSSRTSTSSKRPFLTVPSHTSPAPPCPLSPRSHGKRSNAPTSGTTRTRNNSLLKHFRPLRPLHQGLRPPIQEHELARPPLLRRIRPPDSEPPSLAAVRTPEVLLRDRRAVPSCGFSRGTPTW